MARVRTVATFESSAFNATERRDYFMHEGAYGDDIADWLMDELRARDVQTDDEARQDEAGWHFGIRRGEIDYKVRVSRRPGSASRPPVWIGRVERKTGRLGTLLHAPARAIEPDVVFSIHAVLNSSLLIRNLRWHYQRDFDAGREQFGESEPMTITKSE